MCENNCVNNCQGTAKVSEESSKFTLENMYVGLYKSVQMQNDELTKKLENEKFETERFRQLYMAGLGYIYKAISENNVGILNEAINKFAELESNYAKK